MILSPETSPYHFKGERTIKPSMSVFKTSIYFSKACFDFISHKDFVVFDISDGKITMIKRHIGGFNLVKRTGFNGLAIFNTKLCQDIRKATHSNFQKYLISKIDDDTFELTPLAPRKKQA